MRSNAQKAVLKSKRDNYEQALAECKNCPNTMFRLTKGLKNDSKVVEGGNCMRVSDGKLRFS